MGARPTPTAGPAPPQVVWRGEAAGGERLAVVEGQHMSAAFRVLRAGHSILGGIYFEPDWFAGQSIYDVFYIHEGVRCVLPPPVQGLLTGRG